MTEVVCGHPCRKCGKAGTMPIEIRIWDEEIHQFYLCKKCLKAFWNAFWGFS